MVKGFGVVGVAQMNRLIEMVVVEVVRVVTECRVVEQFSIHKQAPQVQIIEV